MEHDGTTEGNGHGDLVYVGDAGPEARAPAPAAIAPPGLRRGVSEALGTIERLILDTWMQAAAEAEELMASAQRDRERIRADAEQEAQATLARARDRAAEILAQAREQARAVAARSEELSREFVSRLTALSRDEENPVANAFDGEGPGLGGPAQP